MKNSIVNASVAKQGIWHAREYSLNKDSSLAEESKFQSVLADITDIIDYLIDTQIIIRLISFTPRVGSNLAFLLTLLVEGKALLGYKLSMIGMSREKRQETLAKNIYFAFGLEVALYGSASLLNALGERIPGIKHPDTIHQAILDCLFPYFILLVLLNDKPLPGKKESIDIFYLTHEIINFCVRKIAHFIFSSLAKIQTGIDWRKHLKELATYPLVESLHTFLLYPDLESIEELKKNPLTKNFFDIYAQDLQKNTRFYYDDS